MTTSGWLLILGLASGSIGQPSTRAAGAPAPLTAEELEAVVAALQQTAIREGRLIPDRRRTVAVVPDATLAFCDATTPYCIHDSTRATADRLLRDVNVSLADAFTSRNARAAAVEQVGERILVIPANELSEMFRGGAGWEEFRRRFGDAFLVRFSVPAIDGDRAAIYVTSGCGGLCGKSWLVTLERRGGRFRVRKARILEIS